MPKSLILDRQDNWFIKLHFLFNFWNEYQIAVLECLFVWKYSVNCVLQVVVQMRWIVEDLTIILVWIQRTERLVSTKTIGASEWSYTWARIKDKKSAEGERPDKQCHGDKLQNDEIWWKPANHQ
jgi:hypothetical protein